MKNNNYFKLISGDFSPADAKEILIHHFTNKIKFHQAKNFSSIERFGVADSNAVKRIPELNESLELIQQLINTAHENDEIISIESVVTIKTSKK